MQPWPFTRTTLVASLLVGWSAAARADQPVPAATNQPTGRTTDAEDRGEIIRAPGAPPRTPIPEPVSKYLSRQYFFLHDKSSPFIENDYRPELFFSYRPRTEIRYRELQVGLQHQSNGLGEVGGVDQTADSREWNYVFGEARWGIQRDRSPREAWFYFTPGIRAWIPFAVSNDLVRYEGYFAAFADVDLRIPNHPDIGRVSARLIVRQHNIEANVLYPILARVRCWLFGQLFLGKAERLITAPDSVAHLYFGIGFQ